LAGLAAFAGFAFAAGLAGAADAGVKLLPAFAASRLCAFRSSTAELPASPPFFAAGLAECTLCLAGAGAGAAVSAGCALAPAIQPLAANTANESPKILIFCKAKLLFRYLGGTSQSPNRPHNEICVRKVWLENKAVEKLLLFRLTLLPIGCRQAPRTRVEGRVR